jgi:predicted glutamine amidotransferase
MLALVSNSKIDPSVLGLFRKLAETGKVGAEDVKANDLGHKDGWGIAYSDGGEVLNLAHRALDEDGQSEANAASSGEFSSLCDNFQREPKPGIMIVHLRKASPGVGGMKIRSNTAPFIKDGWAFSHNGTIHFQRQTQPNDSLEFFARLLGDLRRASAPETAISETVKSIWNEKVRYSSLTFLLTNGKALYAYREYGNKRNKDFYAIFYSKAKDSVILCQEKIIPVDWESVPDKSFISIGSNLSVNGPTFIS